MKIDFTKLNIEIDFHGNTREVNCAELVANTVKNMTSDIGLEEICRQIYFSQEAVEIPDNYISTFVEYILASDELLAATKRAIRDTLIK